MRPKNTIPYGYCHCGCGQKTNIARDSNATRGWVRGEPLCYISGHNGRKVFTDNCVCEECGKRFRIRPSVARDRKYCSKDCAAKAQTNPDRVEPPNPAGLCLCGCGKPTKIASYTSAAEQMV